MKKWTNEENYLMEQNYCKKTNEELKAMFNRSMISIEKKAARMGLSKTEEIKFKNRSISRSGERASNWKGGRRTTPKGYIMIKNPAHPHASAAGLVQEHRLVMELHLGRYLDRDEIIHHKNGIKNDNRIENLELMKHGEHTTSHHTNAKRSDETKRKISEKAKARLKNPKNHPSYKNVKTEDITNDAKNGISILQSCRNRGITAVAYYNRLRKGIQ